MKKIYLGLTILVLLSTVSCIKKDISKSLHYSYAGASKVGVQNIDFESLRNMKKGEACAYNFLYVLPLGNNSIIASAKEGEINKVVYIGESGYWSFPFSKTCTVTYGN